MENGINKKIKYLLGLLPLGLKKKSLVEHISKCTVTSLSALFMDFILLFIFVEHFKIYYLIAMSYHRLKDETKSNENLEKAMSYAPNSQLGKKIQGILDSMKNDKKSPESPPK